MVDNVYANAFGTDTGRCFRYVYEADTTRPTRCPSRPARRGWWRDNSGRWWQVDACADHESPLRSARNAAPLPRCDLAPGAVTAKG